LIIRGTEVLPEGATIEGKIISVLPASPGNKDGSFELEFGTLQLKNKSKLVIDASWIDERSKPKSSFFKSVAILSGTVVGAVLGGVVGKGRGAIIGAGVGAGIGTGTAFLKKGNEIRIKANEEFDIRLNKEVTLPVKDF
jgi:hypothetical protein